MRKEARGRKARHRGQVLAASDENAGILISGLFGGPHLHGIDVHHFEAVPWTSYRQSPVDRMDTFLCAMMLERCVFRFQRLRNAEE